MQKFIFFLLCLFLTQKLYGQSCCSGGAPLVGNLGLPIQQAKSIQIGLIYDYNKLNTLKSGSETLNDNTRIRITHTTLLQVAYTLKDFIAFELLLPYVQQERKISPLNYNSTFEYTRGIGDIVFLAKYQFLKNYQIGLGLKFPTGSSTELNSNGIILNADMQPGSGSWDIISYFNSNFSFNSRQSTTINTSLTYKMSGTNSHYLDNQQYKFGNEFIAQLGLSDQFLILNQLIQPGIILKYRNTSYDVNNDFNVPSTGGNWLFIQPSLSYLISQNISIRSSIDIPIYAKLEGTQITPTYRLNFSLLLIIPHHENIQ